VHVTVDEPRRYEVTGRVDLPVACSLDVLRDFRYDPVCDSYVHHGIAVCQIAVSDHKVPGLCHG